MLIKSIEIENIRSYSKTKIEFNEGINFLSGDIGSGKTSILLSIEFALFGFKKGDIEGTQLLRKGAFEGNVILNLTDNNNNNIEIYRKIKKSKKNPFQISQENGYIKYNSNIEELTPTQLNAKIFEILSFPEEFLSKNRNLIYRYTIYTPQEQLKEILFSPEDERLEVIRKIFKIDKYKSLRDAISIYSSTLRERKNYYQAKTEDKDKKNEKIKLLNKELQELKTTINKINENEEKVNEYLKKLTSSSNKLEIISNQKNSQLLEKQKEFLLIEENERKITELEKEINKRILFINQNNYETLEKNIQECKKKISKIESNILDKKSIKELINNKLKEFEQFEKEKENLSQKINKFKNKKELLMTKKKEIDIMLTKCRIKDIQYETEKKRLEYNKIKKELSRLEEEKEKLLEIEHKLQTLNKLIEDNAKNISNIQNYSNCPLCIQQISPNYKIEFEKTITNEIIKSKKEIEELEKKRDIIKSQTININDKKEILENILTNLSMFDERLKNLIEKEKEEKELLEKINLEERNFDSKELNKNEELLQNISDTLKEKEKFRMENEQLSTIIFEMEKEIINNNSVIKDNQKLIEEINKNNNEILDYEKKVSYLKGYIKNKKKIHDELENIKEQLKENNLKKKSYQDKLDEVRDKYNRIIEKKSNINTNIENLNTWIKENENDLENIKLFEEKLSKLLSDENFLTKKLTAIAQLLEKAMLTKYYIEFNEIFEKLFRELIEDNDIEVRLSELFSPIVEQNGYDTEIKNLSGGEKSSLAIAYRMGLKHIIEQNLEKTQKLDFVILDEPTDGFSDQQIDRLGNILKESQLKQIILVSHDEKIESISDSIIKIEKTNHQSKII